MRSAPDWLACIMHTSTALLRRGSGCDRVGGTLLGSKEGNVVEIRSCYAVPLSEVGDQARPCTSCWRLVCTACSAHTR